MTTVFNNYRNPGTRFVPRRPTTACLATIPALLACLLTPGISQACPRQQQQQTTPSTSASRQNPDSHTDFTYRGQLLRHGQPLTDMVDFEFTLWDAAENGNRIGQPQWVIGHYVIDGLFSVSLDFGAAPLGSQPGWLEITILSSLDTEPITLTPRQRLAPLPAATTGSASQRPDPTTPPAKTTSHPGQYPESGGKDNLGNTSGTTIMSDADPDGRFIIPPDANVNGDGDGDGDEWEEPAAGPWQQNGNDIYYDLGNVGIGTATPGNPLQVETATANATAMVGWARGSGSNLGVYGLAGGATGTGVFGLAKAESTGTNFGGRFESRSTAGRGVYGIASAHSDGQSYGGWFQSNSTQGRGIQGYSSSPTGRNYGGLFQADGDEGRAVYGYAANTGSKTTFGGYFQSRSTKGRGIFGYADAAVGVTFGVLGQSNSTRGRGVYGVVTAAQGGNYGVYGESSSNEGTGVYGYNTSTTGTTFGLYGRTDSESGYGTYAVATDTVGGHSYAGYFTNVGTGGVGLLGIATASTGTNYGVHAQSNSSSGTALYASAGSASGSTKAVWGSASSSSGYAAYFTGGRNYFQNRVGIGTTNPGSELTVLGTAYVEAGPSNLFQALYGVTTSNGGTAVIGYGGGGGTGSRYGIYGYTEASSGDYGVYADGNSGAYGFKKFHIDDPTDPENKYLDHYAAEGPEPYLMYRGNVVLDDAGQAWVEMPAYFESINRDFHYQLTAIGAPGPNLYVADEIVNNRFRIAGGSPGGKVSWTVTGIRNDPWAQTHPIRDTYQKPADERGKYIRPDLYGQPEHRSLFTPNRTPQSSPSNTAGGVR